MTFAVLGIGIVGTKIAERLIKAGHQIVVFNHDISKTEPLRQLGVRVAVNPLQAVQDSDCILLLLSNNQAIQEVFLDQVQTLTGKTVIQMGTIAPSQSRSLRDRVNNLGGDYLECPILGSRGEIENQTVILLIGSSPELYEKWQTFLQVFGPNLNYVGDVGQAAAIKLALNQLIASHAIGFSLSLGIVEQNDIGVENFMRILKQSSLYTPMFDKKLGNWQARKYDNPNFPSKHLLKDIELIIDHAKDCGLNTHVIEAFQKVTQQTVDGGLHDADYSAVFETINPSKI